MKYHHFFTEESFIERFYKHYPPEEQCADLNIGGVDCYEKDGTVYLKLETVARGLGFTRIADSGNEVVRWERVDGYLRDLGVPTCGHDDFIPENIFYRLAMKAKNEAAEQFQAKIADEVIPSIRKTGSEIATINETPEAAQMIPINCENPERITVSARDLHAALEVETPYHKWFPRMCEYGFADGTDFVTVDKNVHRADGTQMPQIQRDHQITIDMAKELCMLQRTEKGKQCRQYFIQLEKEWNSPEKVMSRALQFAQKELATLRVSVETLTAENEIMQPKAEYFDVLVERNTLTTFRETAKELGAKPKAFVNFLLEKKYVFRDQKGKLMPYEAKNDGLFEVKECASDRNGWSGVQTLITPKGRETFRLIYSA